MADYNRLQEAMGELEEDEVLEILNQIMAEDGDAQKALAACQEGMNHVGELFESGEYFVSDLIFAGELMTEAVEILKPALALGDGGDSCGRMILCTVKDDLHDIGKNIVRSMLEAASFEVIDLGIDVAPETILETAKSQDIHIIGLSGVLTLALDSMAATIQAFTDAGLRNETRFIIGGAPVSAEACERVRADAWAINPQDTVKICRAWSQA